MKILVLSQYFWPETFIVNDLVKKLVESGHEVCVLTGWPSYPDRSRFASFRKTRPASETVNGATVLRVPLLARGTSGVGLALNYLSFALTASTVGLWKLRGRRFDVIFVFQPSPLSVMLPAAFLRRVFGVPVALWVLDLWPETLVAMGVLKGKTAIAVGHWLAGIAHRQADYIFAQSRRMMAQLQERVLERTKIGYLPNWTVEETRSEVAGKMPAWKDGRFSVVVAGNMGDAQDFPAILDAVPQVSRPDKVHWVFVGDGIRRDWVAEQVVKRGLTNMVSLVGRVPPHLVATHLQAADTLLIALRKDEVFSLTVPARLQTYLSSGRPIVGMIDGEAGDLIAEAGAGICVGAGRSTELARAIDTMMSASQADRDRMGHSGRAFESTRFDREYWIGHIESVLKSLTG